MTAAMDVAYLDLPHVAHVPRAAVLMRMCEPCWEENHRCCYGGHCICADCADDRKPGDLPPWALTQAETDLLLGPARLAACADELFPPRRRNRRS